MDRFETVEFGLEDILEALNNRGFASLSSCSGHLHITGETSLGLIEFAPGAVSSRQDVEDVRDIISQHTSIPFTVRKGIQRRGYVNFEGSVSPRPIPSADEAVHLLHAYRTGTGGPGRDPEKIESMYDIPDLEELARRSDLELRGG